ncbi:MAG TPA: SH3 domain-containing protein, partial [Candidatus Saccharicenans sp.]|nr:SH3 domain-containing protein [Candidatus Saccharicenans sp.]
MNKKVVFLASALILILLSTSLLAQTETTRGVVIQSVENMFSKPSSKVDVVSQALLGTTVKILKTEKDDQGKNWYFIETPDTYQGWIESRAVRL